MGRPEQKTEQATSRYEVNKRSNIFMKSRTSKARSAAAPTGIKKPQPGRKPAAQAPSDVKMPKLPVYDSEHLIDIKYTIKAETVNYAEERMNEDANNPLASLAAQMAAGGFSRDSPLYIRHRAQVKFGGKSLDQVFIASLQPRSYDDGGSRTRDATNTTPLPLSDWNILLVKGYDSLASASLGSGPLANTALANSIKKRVERNHATGQHFRNHPFVTEEDLSAACTYASKYVEEHNTNAEVNVEILVQSRERAMERMFKKFGL